MYLCVKCKSNRFVQDSKTSQFFFVSNELIDWHSLTCMHSILNSRLFNICRHVIPPYSACPINCKQLPMQPAVQRCHWSHSSGPGNLQPSVCLLESLSPVVFIFCMCLGLFLQMISKSAVVPQLHELLFSTITAFWHTVVVHHVTEH